MLLLLFHQINPPLNRRQSFTVQQDTQRWLLLQESRKHQLQPQPDIQPRGPEGQQIIPAPPRRSRLLNLLSTVQRNNYERNLLVTWHALSPQTNFIKHKAPGSIVMVV